MEQRSVNTRLVWTVRIVLLVGFLAFWEGGVRAGILDPFFYSSPGQILTRLAQWTRDGSIFQHIGITLWEMMLGFTIGTLVGMVLGFIMARSAYLGAIFEPVMALFNAIPRLVLAPLFILWLGLGIGSKVVMSLALVVFVVFFATYTGIREVDPALIANARILGAGSNDLTRHVLIPSALSWIFSSLRTSVGFALIGAVVGEYLGSTRGVGYLVSFAESMFDAGGVFAGLVVMVIMAGGLDFLIGRVEARLTAWKPQHGR
ncbi:MAG: ABC transporter permease [Caldilineae bacterium]|nr:MAG: ABC transporter permease [Caldilineae bacterium]